MVSEGVIIKNKIKGMGLSVSEVALQLGMSPQGFEYHLKKAKLNKDLKGKIFGILKEHEKRLQLESIYENGNDSFVELSPKMVSETLNKGNYISNSLKKEVLDMGMLLKMSIADLNAILNDELDVEKYKLIQEVISTKKEIEHLKKENKILNDYNDALRKQIGI